MLLDTDGFKTDIYSEDSKLRDFFSPDAEIKLARAPGRLDVLGGVADYSGSLVATAPIGEATYAALQKRSDNLIRVFALDLDSEIYDTTAEYRLDDLTQGLSHALTVLKNAPQNSWALYVVGAFVILAGENMLPSSLTGANIAITSKVPISAGLSSSAALEVATLEAINAAYGVEMSAQTLARLAQKIENLIIGAPCGIMDQMTCVLGKKDHLFLLLCQPDKPQGYATLPKGVQVYGIHSGVKHSVADKPYVSARVAAFMGKKIINSHRIAAGDAPVSYLCDISPDDYRKRYAALIPQKLLGRDYIDRFGAHDDPITEIDPLRVYPLQAGTEHPIYENARVHSFLSALEAFKVTESDLQTRANALTRAGKAMYGSHWSYSRIGLGCAETSLLVRLAREAGAVQGIYGAKITGGGAGGSVALLTYGDAENTVVDIASEYARRTGNRTRIVAGGASDGSALSGVETISLATENLTP